MSFFLRPAVFVVLITVQIGVSMDAPPNRKRRRRCRDSWVLWNILSASYLLLSGTGVNGTRIGPAFSTSQGLVDRRPILPRRHRVDKASWTRGAATLTSDVGATWVAENMAPEGSGTVLRYSPARLGEILGGSGRGKMVWKALQRGKDPFETNSEVWPGCCSQSLSATQGPDPDGWLCCSRPCSTPR